MMPFVFGFIMLLGCLLLVALLLFVSLGILAQNTSWMVILLAIPSLILGFIGIEWAIHEYIVSFWKFVPMSSIKPQTLDNEGEF